MTLTQSPIEELVARIVQRAEGDGGPEGDLVHLEHLPARLPRFGELARPLRPAVHDALGHYNLWSHQAAAIDLIRAGHSVVVATGTASGKSLCYQAPIAESV